MKAQTKKKIDELEVTLPFDEAMELFEKNMQIACTTPKEKVMASIKAEKDQKAKKVKSSK
jgi:hypothetical protein